MTFYVVYGDPVFTNTDERDAVAERVRQIVDVTPGLVQSARVRGISPGVTIYDYLDPWTDTLMPGVRIAFHGLDQQVVNDAAGLMGDEIYARDPQAGGFGTWTDTSA